MSERSTRPASVVRGRIAITAALVSFVIANAIHNQLSLDAAPAPAALLTALLWWKPHRVLLLASAAVIALPAFSFLQWEALAHDRGTAAFWNHVCLLLAGALAALGAVMGLMPVRAKVPA